MTSGIKGSGGAGVPKGPGDVGDVADAEGAVETGAPLEAHAARAAAPGGAAAIADTSDVSGIDRIAADLDAGRISGREALDRLIDEAVPGDLGLDDAERAELRAAMAEMIANDPHLAGLAARIGAETRGSDD